MSHVPYCFVQGLGRPDATAKLFLAELVPYAAFAWWMIRHEGIGGAAVAWSIRVAIEALLLMLIAWRIFSLSPRWLLDRGMMRGLRALCVLGLVMIVTKMALRNSFPVEIGLTGVWLAGFALAIWKYVFDDSDRGSVLTLFDPMRNALKNRGAACQ
jgi:O-antigen/teichoic acid export membrane protein